MSLWQLLTELFAGEERTPPPLHLLRRVDALVPVVTPPNDAEIEAELAAIARPFFDDYADSPDPWADLITKLEHDNEQFRKRFSELESDLERALRCAPDFK